MYSYSEEKKKWHLGEVRGGRGQVALRGALLLLAVIRLYIYNII